MKRKVKRYSTGDQVKDDYESSDDAKNLIAAAAREKADYEASQSKMPNVGEPVKMASFKEAFREARGRGDKTFEYMGKKYTTEMAGGRGSTTSASAPSSQSMDRSSVAARKPGVIDKLAQMSRNPTNPRLRRELAEGTRIRSEMKKGGKVSSASSRADGIAQRGKTRGRII
jgi:hypothetical protein